MVNNQYFMTCFIIMFSPTQPQIEDVLIQIDDVIIYCACQRSTSRHLMRYAYAIAFCS